MNTTQMKAVRAPELDSSCDQPDVAPAWRVTRGGVMVCIAEASTEAQALAYGEWESAMRTRKGAR